MPPRLSEAELATLVADVSRAAPDLGSRLSSYVQNTEQDRQLIQIVTANTAAMTGMREVMDGIRQVLSDMRPAYDRATEALSDLAAADAVRAGIERREASREAAWMERLWAKLYLPLLGVGISALSAIVAKLIP